MTRRRRRRVPRARLAERDTVAGEADPLHRCARRSTSLLIVLGVLWLVPTLGLFLTSILPAQAFTTKGWWQIFSKPSLATWSNYSAGPPQPRDHALAARRRPRSRSANTLLVIVVGALAGYAFAWLDFPGRDWIFIVVIALLVVPLQMALIPIFSLYNNLEPLRHRARDHPLPRRVRAAVRDLPAAQLLHRDPEGHPRVGAHRRRLGDRGSSCA